MLDWSSPFAYIIITVIILIGVGIYALISAKKFIKIVFGVQILILASSLLLLSFSTSNNLGITIVDPLSHTLVIFIIIIGLIFAVLGTAIDRQFRKQNKSTKIEFTFIPLDIDLKEEVQSIVTEKEPQGVED